jgi:putative heme degradation protein
MSIKTTQRITRDRAIELIKMEIDNRIPNDVLASILDVIADSGSSIFMSRFDNFIVSEFLDV